ncbi:putative membrane protein [Actinomycetospora succinea]|uniref:Putative membrane protein n=1 Tax=Actinomycetospora succinea TaxID=663603 RepID=A0A4R6VMB5_9PSEU|nr:anthrone oxygenase family protein [Actinomycetospora succinea]TDQ64942.1 putative membrane protein [Actinomycetospora succinea]
MTTTLVPAVTLLAGVLSALLAGLYLAFSLSIMPALARLPDATLVSVMQTINRVIVRPAFAVVFAGAPLVAVVALVLALVAGAPVLDVLVGTLLQVASVAITGAVNIPLNNALDRADPDDVGDVARAREAFERPWGRAHGVRTAATTLGAVALLAAPLL